MLSDDPRIDRHEVDGQTLFLPSADALAEVLAAGELDGRPVGVGRLPDEYRKVTDSVAGLVIALGADRTPDKPWWVYHLVHRTGRYYRVQVEGQKHGCGWAGVTGNHRVMAVYLGTDDPLARMRANWDAPTQPCPGCGEALDRPALFVAGLP